MLGLKHLVVVISFWICLSVQPAFANITFVENQTEIKLTPQCNHVPISIPYLLDNVNVDESQISVTSDSNWATPVVNQARNQIDISFDTSELISSYTATISVNDGDKVTDLFIDATTSPLNIIRLVDDPMRSITYGIQQNGMDNGSIIAFDPIAETITSCITIGKKPTDFVINDDSSELLVINSADQTVNVIDLTNFHLTETYSLPVYSDWGAENTTANIELGPDDVIYYVDGDWAPMLHVYKRSTGEVIQSLLHHGYYGFTDLAVTRDKSQMVAMPQYGWSAGAHTSVVGQFSINNNGTVNFIKTTEVDGFPREPFEAPVLLTDDDKTAVLKTISTNPSNTDLLERSFPSVIWSMNANGSVVATGDKLYDYETGQEFYELPKGITNVVGYTGTVAQAFTSDYTRFVYFSRSDRTLNVVNLIDEIGLEQMGRTLVPADGSLVNAPSVLTWSPFSGVDLYDVYLCTDRNATISADRNSDCYVGRINGTSVNLSQQLTNQTDYFWRVDPVTSLGPESGPIYTFTVSKIGLDKTEITAQTITQHANYQVQVELMSEDGVAWSASSSAPWITFTNNQGVSPSTLNVNIDATSLSAGFHNGTISLSVVGEADVIEVPVELEVDPLQVTHIRSDRSSETVYAISEDTSAAIKRAYLLEIDSTTETVKRVVRAGNNVTDLALHYTDNLIYVANWKSGNLLAFDKTSLERVDSFAFKPAGATGYSEGDVYRVAAGVSQRLVIEEEDQWIDINLFNTHTKKEVDTASTREGGGAFDPTGRFYYHGENNSSGAGIIKYDTAGDTFTTVKTIRPIEQMSSSYGSRTVLVSEDGSTVFWAGAVLDEDLNPLWGTGESIYSTSTDGRYAFSSNVIYDTVLKRKVLNMPTTTTVSGFNSTNNKLMVQVGEQLQFYNINYPISIPAPTLVGIYDGNINSLSLNWVDNSLEMAFVIQAREYGEHWVNIQTLDADITTFTVNNVNIGAEYRIRATANNNSSSWSNIVSTDVDDDGLPDNFELLHGFDPTKKDSDGDGTLDTNEDLDGDGLSTYEEYLLGTSPNNTDSDNDGLPDSFELSNGLDPLNVNDASLD
ncbi:hypothetical protein CWC15_21815, partial [Pseudoalteromonas spongiae]